LIIPHLLFAHLVGDYLLQTGWLAARKSQALDGLLLHTTIVFVMSVLALAPYISILAGPLLVLYALHTLQDALKAWLGPRLNVHFAWTYFADQAGHLLVILGIQVWVDSQHLAVNPSDLEIFVMSLGASLILVTRAYEVSWWANWFEMIVYMSRWQVWSYVERAGVLLVMTLGGVAGLVLVPFFALPRLVAAARAGTPLWRQRYGLLEWGLGILVGVIIGGSILHPLLQKVG
jgi:hypothetical protein